MKAWWEQICLHCFLLWQHLTGLNKYLSSETKEKRISCSSCLDVQLLSRLGFMSFMDTISCSEEIILFGKPSLSFSSSSSWAFRDFLRTASIRGSGLQKSWEWAIQRLGLSLEVGMPEWLGSSRIWFILHTFSSFGSYEYPEPEVAMETQSWAACFFMKSHFGIHYF